MAWHGSCCACLRRGLLNKSVPGCCRFSSYCALCECAFLASSVLFPPRRCRARRQKKTLRRRGLFTLYARCERNKYGERWVFLSLPNLITVYCTPARIVQQLASLAASQRRLLATRLSQPESWLRCVLRFCFLRFALGGPGLLSGIGGGCSG